MKRILFPLLFLLTLSTSLHATGGINQPRPFYRITGSDHYKTIGFWVPKNGSRTLGAVLNATMGHHLNIDPRPMRWTKYNPQKFGDYFKFIFVRNPWERTLSCYLNKVITDDYFLAECRHMSFEEFVYWLDEQDLELADSHVQPQCRFIPPGVELDFVGRMETFEEDLTTLMNHLGLPIDQIPHKNASKHDHYSHYYNDHTRELIRKIYEEDIVRFGYEFETPSE